MNKIDETNYFDVYLIGIYWVMTTFSTLGKFLKKLGYGDIN